MTSLPFHLYLVTHERQTEQEQAAIPHEVYSSDAPKPGVLEFDDTSEFVRSITYTPAPSLPVKQDPIIVKIDTKAAARSGDSDNDDIEDSDQAILEMEADVRVKQEEDDEDVEMGEDETSAMLNAIEDAIKKSEADAGANGDVKAEPSEAQDGTAVR